MTKLTNAQMEKFKQLADKAAQYSKNGMEINEVMQRYYLDNIPGATEDEAKQVTEQIINQITEFDNSFADALNQNLDSVVDGYQDKADDGRTCIDRCNFWESVTAALQKRDAKTYSEAEVNEELAAKLRADAKKALMEFDVSPNALNEKADYLAGFTCGEAAGNYIINIDDEFRSNRALTAMVAYVAAKNGEMDDIDIEADPRLIAVAVCTATEESYIAQEVEKGNLPLKVATRILQVLFAVSILIAFIIAFKAGLCILAGLVISPYILLITKMIMIMSFVYLGLCGIGFGMQLGEAIAKGVFDFFGNISSGFRKLANEKETNKNTGTQTTGTTVDTNVDTNTNDNVIDDPNVVVVG